MNFSDASITPTSIISKDDTSMGLRSNGTIRRHPRKRDSAVQSTTTIHKYKNKESGSVMINQYR